MNFKTEQVTRIFTVLVTFLVKYQSPVATGRGLTLSQLTNYGLILVCKFLRIKDGDGVTP